MIHVVRGDLREQRTSALLRPIRSDLAPVNALSRDVAVAAGAALEERLGRLGSIPMGGAVITPGGDLPAEFVIHVVVMSAEEPQSTLTVQKALRNGLRRASDWGVESLALPPLGIGAGTIDADDAAYALVQILLDHLEDGAPPSELTVVVSSEYEAGLFERILRDATRERTV